MPFELPRFIEDCRRALGEAGAQAAIRDLLMGALDDRAALRAALGEPKRAGIQPLHHTSELTILSVVWAPHINEGAASRIEAASARSLSTGDVDVERALKRFGEQRAPTRQDPLD